MITTYEQLIQHYGSPLNAAIGLGIIKPETKGKRKSNAIARICNWKTNGLPKRDRKLRKAFSNRINSPSEIDVPVSSSAQA